MASIRLISEDVTIHFPNLDKSDFFHDKNYILRTPSGRFTILCFASHLEGSKQIHPMAQEAIDKNIGVVYVCEAMPDNPIIHDNIVYVQCPYRWYTHTLFLNPLQFKAVFSAKDSERLARCFSEFTSYQIPLLRQHSDLDFLSKKYDEDKDNILLEITGGVGDHLMCIPTIKTLSSLGKKVYILCEKPRVPCFDNLPYIAGIYTHRSKINVSKYEKIIILHFGQTLNDYRSELNKQNRIFSVAALCGLEKSQLVIDRPEIILTTEELREAKQKWETYSNKIFFGFDSTRVDAKMPASMAQEKINAFRLKGFTVFTSSVREFRLQNCIDMSKQLSLRQLFAMISVMDYVVTIDTAFLHIAGAFEKKTFALMNFFEPSWRCGTYKNCKALTPSVSCHPCVARQFVSCDQWQCRDVSCYSHFNWEWLYKELQLLKLRVKDGQKVPESVQVVSEDKQDIIMIDGVKEPRSIIVKDNDGLGDILMLLPSLKAMQARGFVIDTATKYPEVFKNLSYVRNSYKYDDRTFVQGKYTRKIEISYKLSQYEAAWCRQHRIFATAHLFDIPISELPMQRPEIILSPEEVEFSKKFFSSEKKIICIGFTSADVKREFPRPKRQGLIDSIKSAYPDLEIVLVGDTMRDVNGFRYSNCIDLRGKTNIRELFSIVNRSDYCLSVDTSILHIAGAFFKPTVFIPSSINADWRKYPETKVVAPLTDCYPCNERNCRCTVKQNPGWCMGQVSYEQIIIQLNECLNISQLDLRKGE